MGMYPAQGVGMNSVPEIPKWGQMQSQMHQTHVRDDKHFIPREPPTEWRGTAARGCAWA